MPFYGMYNDWARQQRSIQAFKKLLKTYSLSNEYLFLRKKLEILLQRPLRQSEKDYLSYHLVLSNSSIVKSKKQ